MDTNYHYASILCILCKECIIIIIIINGHDSSIKHDSNSKFQFQMKLQSVWIQRWVIFETRKQGSGFSCLTRTADSISFNTSELCDFAHKLNTNIVLQTFIINLKTNLWHRPVLHKFHESIGFTRFHSSNSGKLFWLRPKRTHTTLMWLGNSVAFQTNRVTHLCKLNESM